MQQKIFEPFVQADVGLNMFLHGHAARHALKPIKRL